MFVPITEEEQIKEVALKLLCAYSGNPAMNPSDVTTLTDLRKLAIDQAREFLREVTTPAETPAAKGVRVSITKEGSSFETVETYKIMKGDRATLGYVQARINEESLIYPNLYVDLTDIENSAKVQSVPGKNFQQDPDLLFKLINKW